MTSPRQVLALGALALVCCPALCPAQDGALKTGSAAARFGLTYEPVDFAPPAVDKSSLANGIPVYYFAERNVPLVNVAVRIAAGSVNDPAGKTGAVEMAAEVLRNGGSEKLEGDALDKALESRGARLSASTTREETWLQLSVLPEDLDWGVGVLADILAHPRFPQEKLDEARARRVVGLKQRLDVPLDSGRALFPQLVYGKGNPWGWTSTEKSLGALTIDDLKKIHAEMFRADRIMLGFSGDLAFEDAQKVSAKYFGPEAFKRGAAAPAVAPETAPIDAMRIYIVNRPDLTQNVVYFGHEGIGRFSPEKYAVALFNEILSGGFSSRLLKEVRSDRGLAYLVGGRIGEGTKRGIYYNVALTKSETTTQALQVMMDVNRAMQEAAPTEAEIELARNSTVNSFVFLFQTAEQIVSQKMTLDAFGYPEDYLANYVGNLKKVTGDEIVQAAKGDIHLDKVAVLVFGAVDARTKVALAKLGAVTEITEEELRGEWL